MLYNIFCECTFVNQRFYFHHPFRIQPRTHRSAIHGQAARQAPGCRAVRPRRYATSELLAYARAALLSHAASDRARRLHLIRFIRPSISSCSVSRLWICRIYTPQFCQQEATCRTFESTGCMRQTGAAGKDGSSGAHPSEACPAFFPAPR